MLTTSVSLPSLLCYSKGSLISSPASELTPKWTLSYKELSTVLLSSKHTRLDGITEMSTLTLLYKWFNSFSLNNAFLTFSVLTTLPPPQNDL